LLNKFVNKINLLQSFYKNNNKSWIQILIQKYLKKSIYIIAKYLCYLLCIVIKNKVLLQQKSNNYKEKFCIKIFETNLITKLAI